MDLDYEIRLNRLVDEALQQPDGQRREFLRQRVSDSKQLEEAWELIQALDEDQDFLEQPVVQGLRDDVSQWVGEHGFQLPFEESGPLQVDKIGPYHLIRPLGAGGMGRVYLAEQRRPVHRNVALKLIRSSVRSPEAQARFDAERQALARLNHPNIGRLLEADTTSFGLQYFVMELVDGQPIGEFCDRQNLDLRQRLALMRDVCLGVQHAHQRQILHRDLKPSNILVTEVDGEAVPKIIDFGIAKMLDAEPSNATSATLGRVLGTPIYMSPEALEKVDGSAELDERSDVYSLGILLYELTSGLRPFEAGNDGLAKLLRDIAEREAPSPASRWLDVGVERRVLLASRRRTEPATLRRDLAGDLEWLVMKSISKDREQRYASAGEMAEDIDRYLRGERVLASPPRIWREVFRFFRRQRRNLALAALIPASVAAIALAATIHHRAEQAQQQLEMARSALDSERLAADRFVYSLGLFLDSSLKPPAQGDIADLSRAVNGFSGASQAGRLELLVTLAELLVQQDREPQALELGRQAHELARNILGAEDPVTRRAERLMAELCQRMDCPSTSRPAPRRRELRPGAQAKAKP